MIFVRLAPRSISLFEHGLFRRSFAPSRQTGPIPTKTGLPVVESILEMQDFWSGPYFHFVEKKVTREELFDLSVAKEAKARLDREGPFGN